MHRAIVTDGAARLAVDVPERLAERLRGLIGSAHGRALLLPRTRSVHTFGMPRPIDAVLLDDRFRVTRVVRLVPGRVLLPRRGVRHVLEVDRSPFAPGDDLSIERTP
jgi:uncharacterized membrane protein (UPF0127 family)